MQGVSWSLKICRGEWIGHRVPIGETGVFNLSRRVTRAGAFLVLLVCCWTAPKVARSVAPVEADLSYSVVEYENGDRLSVKCVGAQCEIYARVGSARHRFSILDSETKLRILPRPLALYSLNQPLGVFSFEVESDCSALSEFSRPSMCVASFRVEQGRILEIVETRREIGTTVEAKRVSMAD